MISTEENQRKFSIARMWCVERGWTFSLVTDQELRSGSHLANIKLLTRYARMDIQPETKNRIMDQLREVHNFQTLQSAAQLVLPNNQQYGVAVLLHLAFHHQLSLSLTSGPLFPGTLIEVL